VTAGSPHNSIARGRSSIRHDRATRRPVLNFSISALTAAEDRQKMPLSQVLYNPNLNARHGARRNRRDAMLLFLMIDV
jgi:hypothetical protein